MNNFEKKMLSTICAMSMAMSSVGAFNVLADYDYSIGEIKIAGVDLTGGTLKSIDDIKTAITALGEVGLENYNTQKEAVISIAKSINLLSEEEMEQLRTAIDENDPASDTYWKRIKDATFAVEAGPVYDLFLSVPKADQIGADNYKGYYDIIDEVGVKYDELSANGQKKLADDRPLLADWFAAQAKFEALDEAERTDCSELLKKIVTDPAALTTDNYSRSVSTLNAAKAKYDSLLDEQKAAINKAFEQEGYPDAEDIISAGEVAVSTFNSTTMEAIKELVSGDITFDNCDTVYDNAQEAKRRYDIASRLGDEFVDTELEEKIKNYIAASDYFKQAALLNTDFTSSSYINDKIAIDNLKDAYEAMPETQQELAEEAKAYVDNAGNDWAEFRQGLIDTAIELIDAISEFDHDTWSDRTAWAQIGNEITAAGNAIQAVAEIDRVEINNINDYTTAKTKYDGINADYAAANAVMEKIGLIGTVGDLPTDNIYLTSITAIQDAEEGYAALSDEQKLLIADEYAVLQTARAEYDELKGAADDVQNALDNFSNKLTALRYSYTNIPAAEDYAEVIAAYNTAYAMAYDVENYGNKLNSLVKAEDTAKKERLEQFYTLVNNLINDGDEFKNAVDGVLGILGITADVDLDKIKAIIEDFTVASPEELETLKDAIDTAAIAKGDYIDSKSNAENNIGAIPREEPYSTYEKYIAVYNEINRQYEAVNPSEIQENVQTWAQRAHELFKNIEDECEAGTAEATWNSLLTQKDDFTDTEKAYLAANHSNELSEFLYSGYRIEQYKSAADYINSVENTRLRLEAVDTVRENRGEEQYYGELVDLNRTVSFLKDTYNDILIQAIRDISGVGEAYSICGNMEAELADRIAAYEFDRAVDAMLSSYTVPVANFAQTQTNNFTSLWHLYDALTSTRQEYVTKDNLLSEKEVELVVAAIGQIAGETDYKVSFGAKIADARTCYDNMYRAQEDVTNYADLIYYETAKAYYDDVEDLSSAVNKDNYTDYLAELDKLYSRYNEWSENSEEAPETANNAVEEAYKGLNKLNADVVTFMILALPDPDEIEVLTDGAALKAVKESLDAVNDAFEKLPIKYKLMVKYYSRYTLDLEAYNRAMLIYNHSMASEVDSLIEAIGYYDSENNITMSHINFHDFSDSITAARNAYDALSDIQKEYVTLTHILAESEEDYQSWSQAEQEAEPVRAMIAALPDVIDEDNYEQVEADWQAADDAIKTLSERAKLFITAEEIIKENNIKAELDFINAYMDIVKRINEEIMESEVYDNIVNKSAINVEYAFIIADIESAYNELTREQKLRVSNYVALAEAKNTYNTNIENTIIKIQTGIDEIDIDAIVTKDIILKGRLDDLQLLVDLLSDENKQKIGSNPEDATYATRLEKLEAAFEKYNGLYDADGVKQLISALGDIDQLCEENYAEKKAAVEAAENAFNTLTSSDKLNVDNYPTLEEWRKAIDSFVIDHRGDVNFDGVVDINDIYKMVQFALGKEQPNDEEFERANIIKEDGSEDESIDIYDILAAIDLIQF